MKALLFTLALVLCLGALATRRYLSERLDYRQDTDSRVTENLRSRNVSSQSLNYAMNRMAQNKNQNAQNRPQPRAAPGARAQGPPGTNGKPDPLADQVALYVKDIQENADQAVFSLEKGLSDTMQPDAAPLHLTLLQAALGIPGNENRLHDIALHELMSTTVDPDRDTAGADGQNPAETKRMIVSTAYKLYLNSTRDPESALNDTQRVIYMQKDQSTRELIIYDFLSRYPDLKPRLITDN